MKKLVFFIPILMLISSCATFSTKPEAKIDRGLEEELPPYNGPKAKIMVAKFGWDVGTKSRGIRIRGRGPWGINFEMTEEEQGYTEGLKTMLVTTLVQSKRFRVLERDVLDQMIEEGKLTGNLNLQGADLLVVASVTAWEPGVKRTGGNLGGLIPGKAGLVLGALGGAVKKSYMAMDIRLIDAKTSEIIAATRVEGKAKEINLGALTAGIFGRVPLAGGLSVYAKTPMEKAIRLCIKEAVKYIIDNTPKEYFKY